jgi:hypothetical protein
MGLEYHAVRFLLHCKASNVSFERLLTLGRQDLMVSRDGLRKRRDIGLSPDVIDRLFREDGFADSFLEYLGARNFQVMDLSAYEGATILHDMNNPVPDELHNRFSCVLDGGTLEHVFYFPTSLENSLRMVEVGGHFISLSPCNNFPGHGFYQMSPDIFTCTLGPQNGFQLEDIFVMEMVRDSTWYRVEVPKDAGRRMEFRSCYSVNLMVRARKIGQVPDGKLSIQQPFYENFWENPEKGEPWKGDLNWLQQMRRNLKKTAARFLFGNPFAHDYFKLVRK